MGSRYGRKKRRQAREQIAELSAHLEICMGEATRQRAERNKARSEVEFLLATMRDWNDEIRALLGPYSSLAIDAQTFRVDHPDQIRQMAIMPPVSTEFLFGGPPAKDSIRYYVETMLQFVCGMAEEDLMRLRRLLTMRIMVGSDTKASAYYSISESAWWGIKNGGPEAQRRLAFNAGQDLVRILAALPKKKQAAG